MLDLSTSPLPVMLYAWFEHMSIAYDVVCLI